MFLFSDWNNFLHISIQLWEKFYIDWLSSGKNILVVFYEDLLKEDIFIPTIERMVRFMNFTIDKERLNCVSKHRKGKFFQGAKCIGKRRIQDNETFNGYIYSKKHIRWINSAIRKVKKAMEDRGLRGTHMDTYENTNIKLNYCSND